MAKKNKMTVLFCFKHNSSGLLYSRETPDNLTADDKKALYLPTVPTGADFEEFLGSENARLVERMQADPAYSLRLSLIIAVFLPVRHGMTCFLCK
ncbi:hypothetical protein [Klebsiella pneumoniae]|uniref:hypothetical protein n=1 Tax=Klebsiella pneumoniae TaxID=573 RepID=UPI001EE7B848|nr:hypothetical protein [Klebsiella pneumoniae]